MMADVRPYTARDYDGLIQVINAVCGEGRWMSTTQYQPTLAWIHALQHPRCGCHLLLVATDGNNVMGWCRLFPQAGQEVMAQASLGVGLLAPFRDQGFGTSLVRQALEWAWATGLERVGLTTRIDNQRAVRVFTRCGFSFAGGTNDGWMQMVCSRPQLATRFLGNGLSATGCASQRQASMLAEKETCYEWF